MSVQLHTSVTHGLAKTGQYSTYTTRMKLILAWCALMPLMRVTVATPLHVVMGVFPSTNYRYQGGLQDWSVPLNARMLIDDVPPLRTLQIIINVANINAIRPSLSYWDKNTRTRLPSNPRHATIVPWGRSQLKLEITGDGEPRPPLLLTLESNGQPNEAYVQSVTEHLVPRHRLAIQEMAFLPPAPYTYTLDDARHEVPSRMLFRLPTLNNPHHKLIVALHVPSTHCTAHVAPLDEPRPSNDFDTSFVMPGSNGRLYLQVGADPDNRPRILYLSQSCHGAYIVSVKMVSVNPVNPQPQQQLPPQQPHRPQQLPPQQPHRPHIIPNNF